MPSGHAVAEDRRQPSPRQIVGMALRPHEEETMGRGILLWLLGIPLPIIILLALFAR